MHRDAQDTEETLRFLGIFQDFDAANLIHQITQQCRFCLQIPVSLRFQPSFLAETRVTYSSEEMQDVLHRFRRVCID